MSTVIYLSDRTPSELAARLGSLIGSRLETGEVVNAIEHLQVFPFAGINAIVVVNGLPGLSGARPEIKTATGALNNVLDGVQRLYEAYHGDESTDAIDAAVQETVVAYGQFIRGG